MYIYDLLPLEARQQTPDVLPPMPRVARQMPMAISAVRPPQTRLKTNQDAREGVALERPRGNLHVPLHVIKHVGAHLLPPTPHPARA